MNIAVYQIISILFAVTLEVLIVRRFVMGKFKLMELVISSIALFILLLAAMFPDNFSNRLAQLLGIKDNINAILFGGLLVSFWLNFRLWMMLRTQDKKMARIVRLLGMKEYQNQENDSL